MSTALATFLALALYSLALFPLVVAAWRPRTGRYVVIAYAIAMLAISATNLGWVGASNLTPPGNLQMSMPTDDDRCNQIIALLEDARLIRGRSPTGELIVDQAAWDDLPTAVRDIATACAERSRPSTPALNSMNAVGQPG